MVRAQVDIEEGAEITISYTEPGVGSVLRRPYLRYTVIIPQVYFPSFIPYLGLYLRYTLLKPVHKY